MLKDNRDNVFYTTSKEPFSYVVISPDIHIRLLYYKGSNSAWSLGIDVADTTVLLRYAWSQLSERHTELCHLDSVVTGLICTVHVSNLPEHRMFNVSHKL